MGQDVPKALLINLGCGENRFEGWVNVDAYGTPDFRHDLNSIPFPWRSDSVDSIAAWHVFEHLANWWEAFCECARILKPGGMLDMRVPDASSDSAITYRDHVNIFGLNSFHGAEGTTCGTNAWAMSQAHVPLKLVGYAQVPFGKYNWMPGWMLRFCATHLRNFIWEQRFLWQKTRSTQ